MISSLHNHQTAFLFPADYNYPVIPLNPSLMRVRFVNLLKGGGTQSTQHLNPTQIKSPSSQSPFEMISIEAPESPSMTKSKFRYSIHH